MEGGLDPKTLLVETVLTQMIFRSAFLRCYSLVTGEASIQGASQKTLLF
ncbi:hypothetical protein BXY39_0170 [Eilatimonas milleporae]|uniref:Uncharacterized protein n=1 Tax=Eilatimonas milleporae TaxID=911205 RepID=A0A3M0CYE2_9PROT|nr:hypothetical protein BXY39_0170 [Eilatimonas milleporae]